MMSRIDRIQRALSAPKASKTETDRPQSAGSTNLPVPIGPVLAPRTFRDERGRGNAEVAAQLIGQDGQRRGLRAGPSLMDMAHDAYNRTEWSGSADRRARTGRRTREKI